MSESAARAERFGLPAPAAGYLWEVASKPVAVRINLDLIDRLEREVVESFRSLTSRGSEVGGLLLGNVQSGNPARVSVEAYELVSCDYARGPLYQLSEADAERFRRAIEQSKAGGLRVVGFFRSHTRKGLGLDAEDMAFFSGQFRDPQQIALLIRPYASKPSTAGIFIWENGSVRGEASYQEFPFRRSEVERLVQTESKPAEKNIPAPEAAEPPSAKPATRAQIVPIASRREISLPTPPLPSERPETRTSFAAEPPAPPRAAEPPGSPEPPAHTPAFAKTELPPSPKTELTQASKPWGPPSEEKPRETPDLAELILPPLERPRSNKMVWITAGAAAALLLLSGTLIYPGFSHKTAPRSAAAPGQDTADLSLHVERSPKDLLLTWNRNSQAIKNAARATLAITDGDQHENVNLDLGQLHNGSVEYLPTGSDVSFQLSVIGQNSAETHSESVRVLGTRPSPLAEVAPQAPTKSSAPPSRTEAAGSESSAASNAEPTQVAENRSKPSGPTVKAFHAESLSQRLRPAAPTDLPEAPGLTASAAPASLSLPGLNATPEGLSAPVQPESPRQAPLKAGGHLQQAKVISSKPPEYPLVAKQSHVQGIVVVSAIVGTDGKVKSAKAISGPALLQKAAVDAVRQWIYRPTTLDGAPVESETRVEVRFTTNK